MNMEVVMPNKALNDKSKYIIACEVGRSTGMLRNMLFWYWAKTVSRMSEGEILRRYYELTGEKDG